MPRIGDYRFEQQVDAVLAQVNSLSDAEIDAYRADADKLIWVEINVFGPANIAQTVCTNRGEVLAEAAELAIEKRISKARF